MLWNDILLFLYFIYFYVLSGNRKLEYGVVCRVVDEIVYLVVFIVVIVRFGGGENFIGGDKKIRGFVRIELIVCL